MSCERAKAIFLLPLGCLCFGAGLIIPPHSIAARIGITVVTGVIALLVVLWRLRQIKSEERQQRYRDGLCMTCGYSLTGNVSGICPECGTHIVEVEIDSMPPYSYDRGIYERLWDLMEGYRGKRKASGRSSEHGSR